ncbi:unnamed protein product [Linum trigynum]|uniref:Uncharacterized protein n=1 Tax=Linum trigynum TaxID=586398 RepID=A0AAV2FJH2_9ROSI
MQKTVWVNPATLGKRKGAGGHDRDVRMKDKEEEGGSKRGVVLALPASEKSSGTRPEKQQEKVALPSVQGKGTKAEVPRGEARISKAGAVGDRGAGAEDAKSRTGGAAEDRGKQGVGVPKAGGGSKEGKGKQVVQPNLGKVKIDHKSTAGGHGSLSKPKVVLKVRGEVLKKESGEGKGVGGDQLAGGAKEARKEGNQGLDSMGGRKEGLAKGADESGEGVAKQAGIAAAIGGGNKGLAQSSDSTPSGQQVAFRMTAHSEEEMGDRKRSADLVEDLAKDPTPVKKLCLDDPVDEALPHVVPIGDETDGINGEFVQVEEAGLERPHLAK